jgi:ribA/ribD-fused uncharacterized protein
MAVDSFTGEYRWLSNFHLSPIMFAGRVYPSVENAYQAAKFNPDQREEFSTCSPAVAKRLGASGVLRPNWNAEKVEIMRRLIRQKFSDGRYERVLLCATGNVELIEGNTWGDKFWGVCDGAGKNILGEILMEIRSAALCPWENGELGRSLEHAQLAVPTPPPTADIHTRDD